MFTIGIVGLGLTLVTYKTGSIAASVCVHFMNNLLSVLITKYPVQIQRVLPVLFKDRLSVSDILLLAAVVLICAAVGWMLIGGKKNNKINFD